MCLAIPKQVIVVKKGIINVKAGKKTEIAGSILAVKKGDWVLTQNGIIIKKITDKQAKKINKILTDC